MCRVEAVVDCVPLFNYRSTVLAIADDLTKDGLVLRYRVEGLDRRNRTRPGPVPDRGRVSAHRLQAGRQPG